ncbi:hypothetical protein HYPSUDRAFT_196929 [Hypholoma sublateritium FD-334 SS-4]|uniref:C2H2-type domain-containing protein n=1 Tax=Hypholoma sublateritium (strain FD-334 SS-4) TaxID=945553 RepID=A0A0D2PD56_HYPSF|nr:hypothetical protein HYPSUDRAFT_196929 [Hypholoma sublateritium FD-334 SS-4]
MPPSRTKAPKADTVEHDAFHCDWPGCEKSVSRQYDLLRHKLIHFKFSPYHCTEQNGEGTQCTYSARQVGNLRIHLQVRHGISTTVEALNLIHPKPTIPAELLAVHPPKTLSKKTVPASKKSVARGIRHVDDAPPTYTTTPSPNAYANPAPATPQSSSASLAAEIATFSGWVAPALRPATPTGAAALPAALEYALQSTTYAGWVSADALDQAQVAAPLPQGTAGVFQAQVQEPFVYTQEEAASVSGWRASYQQAPQYAVAAPPAAVSYQTNAYATAPVSSQQNWMVPGQAYAPPISAEASVDYAQQQKIQYQTAAQLPQNPSASCTDTLPSHADAFLTQWTWTDGYSHVPASCSAPSISPTTTSPSLSCPSSSPYSPFSSSHSPSSSSPSSSSSSSWYPPTPPTELAYPNPATIIAQQQEYARFSGNTAAPPPFARDFQFTQEGLTRPKALAVAPLADFAGLSLPSLAVESQPKSEAQLQLESEAQMMAEFEALFGAEVTPAKVESDYFDFDFASCGADADALSYWGAWGQC